MSNTNVDKRIRLEWLVGDKAVSIDCSRLTRVKQLFAKKIGSPL